MAKKFLLLSILYIFITSLSFRANSWMLDGSDQKTKLITGVVEGQSTDSITTPEDPYIFASLPAFDQQMKTSFRTADARPEIVRQYLHKFESPLEPSAELIVQLSDQYKFDYRWLVAIAQQESNLCKHIPDNSYNCWGWGIYPEPGNPEVLKVTRFDSYEDALRRIAPQFTKIFLKGKESKDPMEVMKTYTPPSDGSWADGVSTFFGHLE